MEIFLSYAACLVRCALWLAIFAHTTTSYWHKTVFLATVRRIKGQSITKPELGQPALLSASIGPSQHPLDILHAESFSTIRALQPTPQQYIALSTCQSSEEVLYLSHLKTT
ncbi:unnamed protein product [Protopolystoma xenopodis]|uniref:Uncharacterized protein n=1 Tax=Protopolystoma xenopodis TaxID=117903 RepID=A0A448X5N8_9PLAT|nr:unnamed protein product [Protopolystoma xenopodis]